MTNNNNVQVLKEQNVLGTDFKVYGTADEPLFLAKDVAQMIEYPLGNTTNMLKTVDEDEKLRLRMLIAGQNREVIMETEDGLYEVLMQSRKPIAKAFKKEVKVMLKSIRKHGAYMTEDTIEQALTSPDFLIQLATTLKEEQTARKLAEEQKAIAEAKIVELEPKAFYYDEVLDSQATFTTTQIAKDLGYTAQKLNYILNLMKIQYKVRGQWVLYSQHDGQGYTDTKTFVHSSSVSMQTLWTQKGRKFIIDKLTEIKNQYI